MVTNATNIVRVHGFWADGSSWSKVIPILRNAGHQVVAVQFPLHSVADDVATVKHALEQLGRAIILEHELNFFEFTPNKVQSLDRFRLHIL